MANLSTMTYADYREQVVWDLENTLLNPKLGAIKDAAQIEEEETAVCWLPKQATFPPPKKELRLIKIENLKVFERITRELLNNPIISERKWGDETVRVAEWEREVINGSWRISSSFADALIFGNFLSWSRCETTLQWIKVVFHSIVTMPFIHLVHLVNVIVDLALALLSVHKIGDTYQINLKKRVNILLSSLLPNILGVIPLAGCVLVRHYIINQEVRARIAHEAREKYYSKRELAPHMMMASRHALFTASLFSFTINGGGSMATSYPSTRLELISIKAPL